MTAPQAEARPKAAPAPSLDPAENPALAGLQAFMVKQKHKQTPVAESWTIDTTAYQPATVYNAATISGSARDQ